jgi:hypothetical protein
MIEKYIPWAVGNMLQKSAVADRANTGDGLKMSLWANALIGRSPHCAMLHFIDGATPMSGILYVNLNGERFCSSGASMEFLAERFMRQKENAVYQVWDSAFERPVNPFVFGAPVETFSANTLDDLAAQIGVDADGLKKTVDRWNELVQQRVDSDFYDDLTQALTIKSGPFSAQECPVGQMAMMGGPVINADMQVLSNDYKPIEGFFAAGTGTCGFWGLNYPTDVKAGICRSMCATSGYWAGKQIGI